MGVLVLVPFQLSPSLFHRAHVVTADGAPSHEDIPEREETKVCYYECVHTRQACVCKMHLAVHSIMHHFVQPPAASKAT